MNEAVGARYWFDPMTNVFRGSLELSRLVGCDGCVGSRDEFFTYVDPRDLPMVKRILDFAVDCESSYELIYRLRCPQSTRLYVKESGCFRPAADRSASVIEAVIEPCGPSIRGALGENDLDPLTGLLTRPAFLAQLEQLLEEPAAYAGVALCFLDLDRFRLLNDTLGHHIGDQILCEVAGRLVSALGADALIARSGGDDFMVAIRHVCNASEASRVAKQIREAFFKPFMAGKERHSLTASVGISTFPVDGVTLDELLQSADAALHDAKHSGEGISLVTAGMRLATERSFGLELEFQDALKSSRELIMHFQPIRDFRSGEISGAEALLRWNNPRRGLVGPSEFIPLIEKNPQLMRQLASWTLNQVLSQIQTWLRIGITTRIWLNVNPMQINDPSFTAEILDGLSRRQIPPGCFGIELTERTFIGHGDAAIVQLDALRCAGVWIALDDFGVEYSSLNYAYRLPIDLLKIDSTFVSGIETLRYEQSIVKTILRIAAELGVRVTAEGIERIEQYHKLREMGCHEFQGFLFAPPLEPGQFLDILRDSRAS